VTTFHNPPLHEIAAILQHARTIAVVGLSPKTNRPSHQVAKALQSFGYRVLPVRPAVDNILGEKAYASLDLIEEPIDVVDVFRAPQHIAPIVDDCIRLKIATLWLQDGVINPAQALRAQAAGITVIMDRCTYRDYVSLIKA